MGTPLLRRLTKATFALFLALSLGAGSVLAQDIFVSTNGNDLNDGLTAAKAKRTIQAGINAATAGQNVGIAAGFYDESVTVDKLLTLSFDNTDGDNPIRINNLTLAAPTSGGNATSTTSRADLFIGEAQPLIVLQSITLSNGFYANDNQLQLQGGGTFNWNAGGTSVRFTALANGGGGNSAVNTLGAYDLVFGNSSALTFNDTVPGNLDDVTFAGSSSVTVATGNVDDVTINSGATATINGGPNVGKLTNSGTLTGASTLNMSDDLVNNGTIGSGTTLNLSGGTNDSPETISGTGSFQGQVNITGGVRNTSNEITVSNLAVNGGTFDVRSGAVNVQGILSLNGGAVADDSSDHIKMTGNAASSINLNGADRALGNFTINRGVANFLIVDAGANGNFNLTISNLQFPAGRVTLGTNNNAQGVALVLDGVGNVAGIIAKSQDNPTGTLTVDNSSTTTNRTISGAGQIFLDITKTGNNNITFSELTRTQNVTVNAGKLAFSQAVQVGEAALPANINVAGGELEFNGDATINGNATNTATLDFNSTGTITGTVTNNGGTLDLPSGTIGGQVTAAGGTVNVNGGTFNSGVALNGGNVDFKSSSTGGLRMSVIQGDVTAPGAGAITVEGTNGSNNHTLEVRGTLAANTVTLQNNAGLTTTQDLNTGSVNGLANAGVRLKFSGGTERTFTVAGALAIPNVEFANTGGIEIANSNNLTVISSLVFTSGTVAAPNNTAAGTITTGAGTAVRFVEGRLSADDNNGDAMSLAGAPDKIEFANTSDLTANGRYLGTVGNNTEIQVEGTANVSNTAGAITVERLTVNDGLTLTSNSGITIQPGAGQAALSLSGTIAGSGTITVDANAQGNSTSISGSGTAGRVDAITGAQTITLSGTPTLSRLDVNAANGTFNFNGAASITTLNLAGVGGTVNFNSGGPASIAGAATFTGPAINVNRTVAIMGDFTLGATSGTITHGIGDFDLALKGATVTLNAADVFAYNGSGRLNLEGTAAQTLVLGTNVNVARVDMNNSAGVTLSSSGRFLTTTNLLLTDGTFSHGGFLQARGPLNQSGRITVVAGNLAGTIPDGVTPTQLIFQNTASITAFDELSGNLQDVTMAGAAGTTVTSQNSFSVGGVLLLESGEMASGTGNTVTMRNGSQVTRAAGTFSGSIAYPTGGSSTSFRFVNTTDIATGDELAGSGNINNFLLEGSGKVTLAHSPSVTTLTVSSGTLDVADQSISVSGTATNNGAMMGTTGSLRMVGNTDQGIGGSGTSFPNVEIAKTQTGGGVWGTITQTRAGNAATVSVGNFTQTSGNYVLNPANINILQVNGDLNITSGARQFTDGGGTIGVTGNYTAQAATVNTNENTGNAQLNLTGQVRMNGSSMQTITTRQTTGGNVADFDFSTLRIDNATMAATNVRTTTLNLNSGVFNTGSNMVTVTGNAVGNLVRGGGLVQGTLARTIAGNTAGTWNFPMTDGTNFRQLGLTAAAGATPTFTGNPVVTVTHTDAAPNGTNGLPFTVGSGTSAVTVNNLAPMQWTVSTTVAPNAGADPRIQLFAGGLSGVGEVERLRMVIRGGQNEAGNPWTSAGTHVGSLFSGGVPSTIMDGIGGWAITSTQELSIGGDRADNALAALKAPTLESTSPAGALTVAEGATLEVNFAFDPQDADEQIPTAELMGAPDFVSVEVLNPTPVQNLVNVRVTAAPGLEDAQADPYTFQLKVTDAGGMSLTTDVSLTVTNTSQPPVFAQETTTFTVTLGTTITETIAVSDPDGDDFTVALGAGAPAGATLDGTTLTYTPGEVGTVTIPLVASDASGSTTLDITVNTFVYGDPSGDAELSTTDAAAILAHVSGSAPFTSAGALAAADVSGNGEITPFDAALVLQVLVGLRDCFPAEAGCASKAGAISVTDGSLTWANLRTSDEPGLMEVDLVAQGSNILAATLSAAFGEGVEVVGFEAANGEMLAMHTIEGGKLNVTLAGVAPMGETVAKAIVRLPATAEASLAVESEVAINEEAAYTATEEVSALPEDFVLHANYPNPFNPTTTIAYELPNAVDVKVQVFNALGQMVRTLVNSEQKAGKYNVQWDSRSDAGNVVASGVYIYRIQAGSFVATKKMLLVK